MQTRNNRPKRQNVPPGSHVILADMDVERIIEFVNEPSTIKLFENQPSTIESENETKKETPENSVSVEVMTTLVKLPIEKFFKMQILCRTNFTCRR